MNRHLFGLGAGLIILQSSAVASPTANEFQRCQKLAVAVLEHCLRDKPYHHNELCWTRSKSAHDACSQKIYDSHNTDLQAKRREAARAADEARARKLEKQR